MEPPTAPAAAYLLFVGVDIAAATATVSWMTPGAAPARPVTIEQTADGFASLERRLLATGAPPARILVVMEASGVYWLGLATSLVEAGFVVSVVNPAQAHHFAKALLKQAKTDAIDAQTLTQLAARLQPRPWTPPPAIYHELQQRLAQRDALLEIRGQLRSQLHALLRHPVVVPTVQQRLEALIATVTAQLAAVEAELVAVLEQDPAWAATAAHLRSITGLGLITTAWLLVATVNFTVCRTVTEATAYAGLAPNPYQSGTSVRGRPSLGPGGNARLRSALYLATLSGCRYNPVLRAYYQRLRAAGKPMKVARCAAARKLLHIAWAVATKGEPFDPTYEQRQREPAVAA
jgi:transposase